VSVCVCVCVWGGGSHHATWYDPSASKVINYPRCCCCDKHHSNYPTFHSLSLWSCDRMRTEIPHSPAGQDRPPVPFLNLGRAYTVGGWGQTCDRSINRLTGARYAHGGGARLDYRN